MRTFVELLLVAVLLGVVVLFYRLIIDRLFGKKKRGGFTIIEGMIVLAIISILLAIAIPQYQAYKNKDNRSVIERRGEKTIKFYCNRCGAPNEVKKDNPKGGM